MRLSLAICLTLLLLVAAATARPRKGGKGGKSSKAAKAGKSAGGSGGGSKGGMSMGKSKSKSKGSSEEVTVPIDDDTSHLANVQWEGLTRDQMAEFEKYGVVIQQNEGSPNMRFIHPGAPTDDDIVNQFPGFGNPNSIRPKDYNFEIPRRPRPRTEPGCLPMGPIGMTVEGYVFYNPYTLEMEDAVEVEIMGKCNGHPSPDGAYHHHALNNCTFTGERDQILGVAFDGIPILGPLDADGNMLKTDDLDLCHGRVDQVNGVDRYRYRITEDFPYILGCYRGEPRNVDLNRPNCVIPQSEDPFVKKLVEVSERIEETMDDMEMEDRKNKRKEPRNHRLWDLHKALKKLFQRRLMGGSF